VPITRSDAKAGRLSSGAFTLLLSHPSSAICVYTRNGIIGQLLRWCRSLLAPLTRGYSIALLVTEAGAKETKVWILAREVGCFARNLRTVPERLGKSPGWSQVVPGPARLLLENLVGNVTIIRTLLGDKNWHCNWDGLTIPSQRG